MGPMQEVADALVKGNFIDTWMTVDYSTAYKNGLLALRGVGVEKWLDRMQC